MRILELGSRRSDETSQWCGEENRSVNQTGGHSSVLLHETIDAVLQSKDGVYVDCTLGGGGHAEALLCSIEQAEGTGRLYGIDRDRQALCRATERLSRFGNRFCPIEGNFCDVTELLKTQGAGELDGAYADLGVSSFQLDDPSRGFSYMADAPLDMRMSAGTGKSARDVVNTYSERELARVLSQYGEERFAGRIAAFLVKARGIRPVETTGQLVDIVKSAIPAKYRTDGPHPAKRTFQALRIEVNAELDAVERGVYALFECLKPGGRIAVISFHSLEDRIVKQAFASFAQGCVCPPEFPVCICGKKPRARVITKKPILPSDQEIDENPRSRSAKLRVVEKLAAPEPGV